MITTVTLNPCIDRMVTVERFIYGGLNRIIDSRMDAAGKGINVAVALHQLGEKAFCTGINYTERGHMIRELLDRAGIPYDFVEVEGEVRVNLKVFDLSQGVVTEINESGHPVSPQHIQELMDKIDIYAAKSSMMVFSGSVPRGVPTSIYKDLMEQANRHGIMCVLDAEGELLLEGLKAQPYMIKPNLYELEKAVGKTLTTHGEIVRAARRFIERGVRIVGVSMGSRGAMIIDENETYYAHPIAVEVKGTAGAGDSMVAGFCLALKEGAGLEDMLRYGVAAATASVMREGTLLCTRDGFESMLPRVEIEKVSDF
ncbi:1-phosphofructokinase [Caldicoprobacter algeriensis]|uniref:1-phosphofructokinase n=1 Tax=Caldicoprobacter algeriensis TaxID=699281 RepID=UPI002079212B|nr:1-phosphofructokinase [Caldicoprobacter algeriensis]MCM8901700.1 1-phosphofructokinase [Caldicoprobacter algeriensis]